MYYIKISATSKRGAAYLKRYNETKWRNIYDCYVNPSQNKRIAEMNCRARMLNMNGSDYRILSYNTTKFTVGWKTAAGNLWIETADNSYYIELP